MDNKPNQQPLKKFQRGLTLIEMLVALTLATSIFIILLLINNQARDSYLWLQNYKYRQSILQNGWWPIVGSLKRVSSSAYYIDRKVVNQFGQTEYTYKDIPSITNNIIITPTDVAGHHALPADYRTLAKAGPSRVNLPSDQLVIQYTTNDPALFDCEKKPIVPYSISKETVVERFYVVNNNIENRLDLMCDAARYSKTSGFSGMGQTPALKLPNIDYFHVLVVSDTYYKNLSQLATNPTQPSSAYIQAVEISALFHTNWPINPIAKAVTFNRFTVLDEEVTLNGNMTNNTSFYDQATSFVALNYYKGEL